MIDFDLTKSNELATQHRLVGVPMQWLLIVKLVVLLTVANGAPVIATKLFGTLLNQALDRGAAFIDGRPILGNSKTLRGIVLSLMATTAFAPILGFEWIDGLIIASAAMVGDVSSSFLKRRLNLRPSSRATGIDQIPECLLPATAIRSTLGLTVFDVISVVTIFFVGEVLLSRLLFKWNVRNRPY